MTLYGIICECNASLAWSRFALYKTVGLQRMRTHLNLILGLALDIGLQLRYKPSQLNTNNIWCVTLVYRDFIAAENCHFIETDQKGWNFGEVVIKIVK